MTEILIYAGIGRATLFAVGVLFVTALAKLGHMALRRWGIVQDDVAFTRVLSRVLILYLLVLPYLVYDIGHASIMDQISRQIESASTHFADAAVPADVEGLLATLESVQTRIEMRWFWAQRVGAGVLAVILVLWTWERRQSRPSMKGLRWALAVGMFILPVALGLQLYAVEGATWNSVQHFEHSSGTWAYQAIDADRVFMYSWHYYILPMGIGPLALGIIPIIRSRHPTG